MHFAGFVQVEESIKSNKANKTITQEKTTKRIENNIYFKFPIFIYFKTLF